MTSTQIINRVGFTFALLGALHAMLNGEHKVAIWAGNCAAWIALYISKE